MGDYTKNLIREFEIHKNSKIAAGQQKYMKDRYLFFGLTSPDRKNIQKPFLLKSKLPNLEELTSITHYLWEQPQRELQYFTQELVQKYTRQYRKEDMELFEFMITHKSWWDTVDYIASNIVGAYLKKYPEVQKPKVEEWIASENMWLQRLALLFQLKYKDEVDTQLLQYVINELLGSKEFFINKAIGWSLRQYSKFNPDWVVEFVAKTPLENLSKREALKIINK